MKISITGHRNGLGKALYDKLKDHHEVTGWDIVDGWDINDQATRDTIINDLDNQDCFINCAYAYRSQTSLLEKSIEKWDCQEKIIINISSAISILDVSAVYNNMPDHSLYYCIDKQMQNRIHSMRSGLNNPRIQNVLVDWFNAGYARSREMPLPNLSPDDVAEQIIHAMPQLEKSAFLGIILIADAVGQRFLHDN